MAHTKVKLAWIVGNSARRTVLRRRTRSLVKKVAALSSLCGVRACAVVYGPSEPAPTAWPSVDAARQLMAEFMALPEADQEGKRLSHASFVRKCPDGEEARLSDETRAQRMADERTVVLEVLAAASGQLDRQLEPQDVASVWMVIDNELKSVEKLIADRISTAASVHGRGSIQPPAGRGPIGSQ